ncbi:MAG: hypothetical protein QXP39_01315 [Candidatus Aenigmatarchaeota archaeon]
MKFQIIFLAFIGIMFCASSVYALDVRIENPQIVIFSGERADFEVAVTNTENWTEGLEISVQGEHLEWQIPSVLYLSLSPNQSEIFNITFLPKTDKEKNIQYRLIIKTSSGAVYERIFSLRVLPEIYIHDIALEVKGDVLVVNGAIKVKEAGKVNLIFGIYSGKNIISSSQIDVWVKDEERFKNEMSLQGLVYGDYVLKISSKCCEVSHEFRISPIKDVVENINIKSGFLQDIVEIEVENKGNQPIYNYTVKRDISPIWFTGFITKPVKCDGGQCDFLIEEIKPGTSAKIVYSISYWPTISEVVGFVIMFIFIVWFYKFRISRPVITKKIVKKSPNDHVVVLEIKSPFLRGVKDAILKDIISPLSQLADSGHLNPVTRKGEKGTELIWRLGNIPPREIRIVNYTIKLPMPASVRLPPAKLNFDIKGKKYSVFSNEIDIE